MHLILIAPLNSQKRRTSVTRQVLLKTAILTYNIIGTRPWPTKILTSLGFEGLLEDVMGTQLGHIPSPLAMRT